VTGVPEVQQAKAALDLASSEHARFKALHDEGVIAPADLDQRRAQLESARQQYEAAKNTAAQQYQALQAARARVTLARKALADTVVRAPFSGVVAERLVSMGDYVTKGTKVAVVVRVNPLRVRLTIPEQFVASVAVGQKVSFEVDAYSGRAFEGVVKYVSPALEANQRALTVEAVVPNPRRELKPGLFATARLEQPAPEPGLVVPPTAVLTSGTTSRVFIVNGDCVEERIVTVGQTLDAGIEITSGLKSGDRVATRNVPQLADGMPVAL
jgi:membrane fusion protein (multidrug efflux system)